MGVDFFGQFLLQRGIINHKNLVEAVELQEARNLKFGRYAVKQGVLNPAQCDRINAEQRRLNRSFGEIAIEMELLTPSQVAELLTLQGNDHIRLGAALVELGHLEPNVLSKELDGFQESQREYRPHEVEFPSGTEADPMLAVPVDFMRKLLLRVAQIRVKLCQGILNPTPPSAELLNISLAFRGDRSFRLTLTMAPETGVRIAKGLFRIKEDPSEAIVIDAMKEFLNIIGGDACATYAKMGKRLEIGPPELGIPEGKATFLFLLQMPGELGEIRIFEDGV